MMKIDELLKKIKDLSPEEQAKAVSTYVSESKRKQTVEEARREVRNKCFEGTKKLTKAQQEALIYEFLNENCKYFNERWLATKHSKLFAK